MPGYFSLVLHAHLPFVRHPEHEKFLEENWLFEAITETYVPLLRVIEGWRRDRLNARITLTLTPTLCAMLRDPLLQDRYARHLDGLIKLAAKEIERTHLDSALNALAGLYHERFVEIRDFYRANERDLVAAFRKLQDEGAIEIITSAATHALLPLLANHAPSLRAQILTARDDYRDCFGRDPRGIWLPECAYVEGIEPVLRDADIRWFILDAHGLMHAEPAPRYAVFAPVFTPNGIAAFARDPESSKQVWSRTEGYPGDPRYREFYRDIGFDLDFDYVRDHLPAPGVRGFTGIKYFRITGGTEHKEIYQPRAALEAASAHAQYFLAARAAQIQALEKTMDRPPLIVAPYDAELFGHWWHEGPEFLDFFVRRAVRDQRTFSLITPTDYLRRHETNQIARPAASSWGEHGYWGVWLNETNQWIVPHLNVAQERMAELAARFANPTPLEQRALNQAARELLLAQASDWPFILRTGTSPAYAARRVKDHLLRFTALYEMLRESSVDERRLAEMESRDNLFPNLNPAYWRA